MYWLFCVLTINIASAQEISDTNNVIPPDKSVADSFAILQNDTLTVKELTDSVQINDSTIRVPKKSNSGLDAPVKYSAEDSVIYDLDSQYVYLYGTAVVTYQDIELQAAFIRFDMAHKEVFSTGMPDSTGAVIGHPVFKQGSDEYKAKILNYNFDSRKAYIESIITEQEGGYLHSEHSKRQSNEQIHSLNNKYTTCDLEHPHFYIAIKKAIMIPNKKIISGPAHFVIEDVPLFFPILPFGFFPTQRKRSAGILVPTFGDEVTRGFYLRDLGYYLPVNDHLDLTIMADLYSKGAWGVNMNTDYVKRYKYSGSFTYDYQRNVIGERGFVDPWYTEYRKIMWNHSQDPKANPSQNFSANVNISSSGYDREYSRDLTEIYSNTKSSSINYTKKWDNTFLNTPFNISASANHNQNSRTRMVNVTMPSISANTGNINVIPKKNEDAKSRFYHDIRTKYTARLENSYSNVDTNHIFWDSLNFSNMQTGFKHSLPITLPTKLFKKLPLNISVGYEGYVFTKRVEYVWDENMYTRTSLNDSTRGALRKIEKDTLAYVHKFNYVPSFNNITLNRNLYFTFQSTKEESKVEALRYVIMPKASFNFTPGRKGVVPSYYDTITDRNTGEQKLYSIYENARSGFAPPGISKKTSARGSVNLSLDNNIEMKIRSRNDTIDEARKVKILESFRFSTNYDFFADSMNLSNINFNTGSKLFKNAISVQLRGTFDPYAINELERRYNEFEWNENGKLARLTNLNVSIGFNLGSKKGNTSTTAKDNESKPGEEKSIGDYEYYNIPWGLSGTYNWRYVKPGNMAKISQTLSFNGNFELTEKWKVSFNSGYDFEQKKITATYLNIERDLHCWKFVVRTVPFGSYKFFEFRINAVASMLKDLKYEFDRNWRDQY